MAADSHPDASAERSGHASERVPVVVPGASAGGLEAFTGSLDAPADGLHSTVEALETASQELWSMNQELVP